jgi:hypothetical protein
MSLAEFERIFDEEIGNVPPRDFPVNVASDEDQYGDEM